MEKEIKEIPKELQLEQNKFVQALFKNYIDLMNKMKQLEEGKGPDAQVPNNYSEKWENIKQYGETYRKQAMTTRRDIRLINGEGRVCCFFCDGVVKGNWRQVINIEACDPECAAQLEAIFSGAVSSYKISFVKQSKK